MAVVLGVNAGFVEEAPVDDPNGSDLVFDFRARANKDTSPATAETVTEIGWYTDQATEAADFEVGIYEHDTGNNEPDDILAGKESAAKGTDAGWKIITGLNITISPSTIYWVACSLGNTTSDTEIDYASSGGTTKNKNTTPTLPANWGTSQSFSWITAVYAVWEAGTPYTGGTGINIGDTWKEVAGIQVNIGDTWKPVTAAKVNIGDAWKPVVFA